MREQLVYVNGEYVGAQSATVSVFDHGLLYGDGVFEGIREYSGNVFRLEDHVTRLYDSAKVIHLKIPIPRKEMSNAILETLRRNGLRDAYVRVVVTRGTGDLGVDPTPCKQPSLFIIAEPAKSELGSSNPRLLSLVISSVKRDPVDGTSHEVKSLNYLNSIMAKMEARRNGVDDALLLDQRGFVSEASASNVFLVKGGKVITPSASSGILRGITRARVIKLCSELGLELEEREVTPFELLTADEVFLAGTKLEMAAVGTINGAEIGSGALGPVVRKLLQEMSRLVVSREEGSPVFEAEYIGVSKKSQTRVGKP